MQEALDGKDEKLSHPLICYFFSSCFCQSSELVHVHQSYSRPKVWIIL